ncbi:DNA polymerase beta superfamily protein [Bacillus solitudinis]|uniref:DNA polymerase beta superfamily protein n=1 Tax=Bacillus solitudinis TaxID=2014074 RepID=UPI0012FD3C94|nr:nucleotidyltransferase domain-containing protein [Bacillus solitudinis]
MNRHIAFNALVGSENYNLSTSESDKDYKLFVWPSFYDLYNSNIYTESKVGETIDEEYHDIRKLVNLFWKSNVNFVEVLFSTDISINRDAWMSLYVKRILAMKKDISTMNLPYLYKACRGMYESKSKYIAKGNKGTYSLVEQFGYDSKSAMHAYRILDFIERFAKNEFTDFYTAMQYDDKGREFMLSVKHGEFTREEYAALIENKMVTFKKLESVYLGQSIREDVKQELGAILYQFVSESVMRELSN